MLKRKEILIIGAGRLGTSLYRLINERFAADVILADIKPLSEISTHFPLQGDHYFQVSASRLPEARLVNFVTVPDDDIPDIMKYFPLNNRAGNIFIHTSGAHDAQILTEEIERNYHIGSFHPLQTFSELFSPPQVWENIVCTYQGDEEGFDAINELFGQWNARRIKVTTQQKVAIHTAAAMISNLFFSLALGAEDILERAGLGDRARDMLLPLITQTINNYGAREIKDAITGPLIRGDERTIRKHLRFLDQYADVKMIYRMLSLYLLDHPEMMGSRAQSMKELLNETK